MVYYLTYVSSASPELSLEKLTQLLVKSREYNRTKSITGLLLYLVGDIIQTIEGPEEEVNALYKRISKDNRHFQIMTIAEGFASARQFSDWSMSGVSLSYKDLGHIEGFEKYDRSTLFKSSDSDEAHSGVKIMEAVTPKINFYKEI